MVNFEQFITKHLYDICNLMQSKLPKYEQIAPTFGTSMVVKQFLEPGKNEYPLWHMHPEMELVYVNGGTGKRYIGNHQSYYQDGDLIMIGPDLPHYGFTDRLTNNRSETIVQMREDFLGMNFYEVPEMRSIVRLISRSKQGLVFFGETKDRVGAKLENLANKAPFERVMLLLEILKDLSDSKEYNLLNASGSVIEIDPKDQERINKIYSHVKQNFQASIKLDDIADMLSMTKPAFCRYFKKVSGNTFTGFVNEYRLVHASKLLAETTTPITEICYECGFNNFSHFNKQFQKFTGKSASGFRSTQTHIVS